MSSSVSTRVCSIKPSIKETKILELLQSIITVLQIVWTLKILDTQKFQTFIFGDVLSEITMVQNFLQVMYQV